MPTKSKTGLQLQYEKLWRYPERIVAGVDEVGRGCLAGPVVTAAAILPIEIDLERDAWILEVTDSKALSEEERESLAPKIKSWLRAYSFGEASPEEIDQLNIHHATLLAMERAIAALELVPHAILVDGKFLPKSFDKNSSQAVVKGDSNSLSIACASIIAKTRRDQMMRDLEAQYPQYGFSSHKGYPTPVHQRAIQEHGVLDIHRKSFSTVSAALRQ